MVYRIVALGFAIMFLSDCVVGRKHDFREPKSCSITGDAGRTG